MDEGLNQAFEFDVSRCRRTMKPIPAVDEGIRTAGATCTFLLFGIFTALRLPINQSAT